MHQFTARQGFWHQINAQTCPYELYSDFEVAGVQHLMQIRTGVPFLFAKDAIEIDGAFGCPFALASVRTYSNQCILAPALL